MYKLVKGTGRAWEGQDKALMEYSSRFIYDPEIVGQNQDDIIMLSHVMLSYGEVGSKLYDMIVLCTLGSGKYEERLTKLVEEFCSTVDIYDFVVTARSIVYDKRADKNYLLSVVIYVACLVEEGYKLGTVTGVYSDKKSVVVSEMSVNPCVLEVYLNCTLHDILKHQMPEEVKLSAKKREKFKKHIVKRMNFNITRTIKELSVERAVRLLCNISNVLRYAHFVSFYNEVSEDYFVDNVYLSHGIWEHETSKSDSELLFWSNIGLSHHLIGKEVLKNRSIYVRDKGVSMILKDKFDDITTVTLREYHSEEPYESHYITIQYTLEEGSSRLISLDLTNITKRFVSVLYEKDVVVMVMVLGWLGIIDKLDITEDKIRNYVILASEKSGAKFSEHEIEYRTKETKEALKYLFNTYGNVLSEDNIEYANPVHWNYDSAGGYVKSSGGHSYIDKETKIGRYVRRLPAGQSASPEAKALAKSVFMELEEGHTLVDSYVRKQKIKVK